MYLILIMLLGEFALGVALGFFVSDSRPGLSVDDLKASSIVFLITTGVVMFSHPDVPAVVFAHLIIGWILISTAMLCGELLRLRLLQYLRNLLAKKDTQLLISDFVHLATRYGFTGAEADREAARAKLAEVKARLEAVNRQAAHFEGKETLNRFTVIGELCNRYYDIAETVTAVQDAQQRAAILEEWRKLGTALTDLSWDALNHAEANIKMRLSLVWSRFGTSEVQTEVQA